MSSLCRVGYKTDMGLQTKKNEDMLLILQGLCTNPQLIVQPKPQAATLMVTQAESAVQPFSVCALADGLRETDEEKARGSDASRLSIETVADVLQPLLTRPPYSFSLPTPSHAPNLAYSGLSVPPTPFLAQGNQTGQMGQAGQASKTVSGRAVTEILLEQWVRDAVRQANRVIYHCNADYDTHMGSTLTVALLYHYHLYVASVGDSRAYLYNAHKGLLQLTTDHTVAARMVAAQRLEPADLYDSPQRHEHERYLGQQYQVEVDLFQHEVEPGDSILLCTDGLWHALHEEDITAILVAEGTSDPQKVAEALINAAKDAASTGNISAIMISMQ